MNFTHQFPCSPFTTTTSTEAREGRPTIPTRTKNFYLVHSVLQYPLLVATVAVLLVSDKGAATELRLVAATNRDSKGAYFFLAYRCPYMPSTLFSVRSLQRASTEPSQAMTFQSRYYVLLQVLAALGSCWRLTMTLSNLTFLYSGRPYQAVFTRCLRSSQMTRSCLPSAVVSMARLMGGILWQHAWPWQRCR
jgi:hypothetical protein